MYRAAFWRHMIAVWPNFLEAERWVGEFHSLIERQRQIIDDHPQSGGGLTSARTVFESLLVSLSLAISDRGRMQMLDLKIVEATAA
jgi:hypothetical protein